MTTAQKPLIELKELRIGNILLYKGKYVHVTSLSMDIDDEYQDTIGFCELGETSNEKSDWNRALYLDLDRVPLTLGLLQKCGFSLNRWENYEHGSLPIEIAYSNGVFSVTVPCYRCDGSTELCNVSYIHHFQNLYYFFSGGKELGVDLSWLTQVAAKK